MIKAVIFDLDGTLLDRNSSLRNFIHDQYNRITELHVVDKGKWVDRFIELDCRGYVWKDRVYSSMLSEFGITKIAMDDLLSDYTANFKNHCAPFPHLYEILDYLMSIGVRLGIITNGLGDLQLGNIKALGIEHYFDYILVSELEGIKKPDPEIFMRALKKFRIDASEAIYVGDHPENDVKASRSVGMKGFG